MITLRSFIDTIRQKISSLDYAADAYLNYANSVTGASDENVGDAIMTLAAGYGQGGGGIQSFEYTATFSGSKIAIPVDVRGAKVIAISMITDSPESTNSLNAYSRWGVAVSEELFTQALIDSLTATTYVNGTPYVHGVPRNEFNTKFSTTLYGFGGANQYGGTPKFIAEEGNLRIEGLNYGFVNGAEYHVTVKWI